MRVFIVHKDIYDAGNPYIYTLKESIEKNHPNVLFSWGEDIFWSDKLFEYDIIHFHWPAAFLDCDEHHHTLDDFNIQIRKAKAHGVKIVSTCHDLCPHYTQGASFADAITFVYENSDAIFHLGEYSKNLFVGQYPNSVHMLLPHHIYDEIYKSRPDKKIAKEKLGLDEAKKYVLCMGAFRAKEERNLILYLTKKLRCKGVEFIAPAFDRVGTSLKKSFPFVTRGLHKYIYYRYIRGIHLTGKKWVPISDEEMPYYYAACDLAFVQRLKILNSGNAVMPLLFGRPVMGPNTGNVGPFLQEYGGYLFDVDNLSHLPQEICKILFESQSNEACITDEKVMSQLSTHVIAEKQYQFYKYIMDRAYEEHIIRK